MDSTATVAAGVVFVCCAVRLAVAAFVFVAPALVGAWVAWKYCGCWVALEMDDDMRESLSFGLEWEQSVNEVMPKLLMMR